ncbi:hypothetical protein Tco_1275400 [Tanacetum coccineum]
MFFYFPRNPLSPRNSCKSAWHNNGYTVSETKGIVTVVGGGLDYNYVAHPSLEVVKHKLSKIAINEALVQKTPMIKSSFPVAWRILLTFVIQIDIGEIIFSDLIIRLMAKSRQGYVSYPIFVSCALEELLVTPLPCSEKKGKKKKSQTVAQPKPKSQDPEASKALPQNRKNSKTQTTSLVQTSIKPPSEKVPTKDSNKTLKWTIPTLLWKSISGLRKKRLENVVRCLTGKLLSMVRSELSCKPTVSSLNNEIDFRVSFDDSDDEDYTVIFDKNSFSYKIIFVNDLKTNSENDNEKVNMPSFHPPKPTVSSFDDLDFFKDFENEFLAIVYNDALTSKSDFLTEPTISIQHIDEFNLKDETSLSECDEEEQNALYFNNVFLFNVIYLDDSKLDKDNDNDKINIKQSLGGNVINTDVGAYAQGSNKLLETRSGYQQKDRKPSQNDKTEHGMEKTVQNQGQSPKMPKSESILKNQQSNRSRN